MLEKERKKKDIVVGINTFHWLSRVQILPLSLILASDLAFLNLGLFTWKEKIIVLLHLPVLRTK